MDKNSLNLKIDKSCNHIECDYFDVSIPECVKTLDQAKMVGVSGKPPNDDEPLLLCKPIRQKTFASGTLIIRPLQIKKMQFVQNDTMVSCCTTLLVCTLLFIVLDTHYF